MAQEFDPVFGSWTTEKSLGSGTDGKAFTITRTNEDGTVERAVLKTIRVGDYRNEKKSFNKLGGELSAPSGEETQHETIIQNITENIDMIRQADRGKHFVRYEEWEKRETSDGKGTLILIRLEEMKSLTQLLESFSLTPDETVRLGISICRSLMRCRDFGYVYPNLKPENILFDRNGVCKLGDFGSFSCLEPSKTSVAYKRTQYYMAPEFIESGKINCTSDTYSLGLVLYTLINRGRLPFAEPYPQALSVGSFDRSMEGRLKNQPFPQPALASGSLWKVIQKACAFRPEDRYLSPKQMLADLERVLQREPLEKAQFEDIFSVSSPAVPTIPTTPPVKIPSAAPAAPAAPAPEKNGFSKSDITIPDVRPMDYASANQQKRRPSRPAPRVSIPEQRTPKRKPKQTVNKRFWILAAIAVALLVLFIVSIALRLSGKSDAASSVVACLPLPTFDGGEFFWPLI